MQQALLSTPPRCPIVRHFTSISECQHMSCPTETNLQLKVNEIGFGDCVLYNSFVFHYLYVVAYYEQELPM